MMVAIPLALFASILCGLGGALLATTRARGQHLRAADLLAAEHARALDERTAEAATQTAQADAAKAENAHLEKVLRLDAPVTSHELLSEACTATSTQVGVIAAKDGLPRVWFGNHDLAESLASLAPQALELMAPGDDLVLRGAMGGEVRALCTQLGSERALLMLSSSTRAASGPSLSLVRLRLERAMASAQDGSDFTTTGLRETGSVDRDVRESSGVESNVMVREMAIDLGLEWLALWSSAGLRTQLGVATPLGSPTSSGGGERASGDDRRGADTGARWRTDSNTLADIARRSPQDICSPLASVQLFRAGGGSVAWIADGTSGWRTLGGHLADEPSVLARIGADLSRRLARSLARAA